MNTEENSRTSNESSLLADARPSAHKRRRFDRRNKDKGNQLPYDRSSYVYTPIPQENSLFEEYYRGFNWMSDDEFDNEFMAALRRPLPTTFRIGGATSQAQELRSYLMTHFVEPLTALSRPITNIQTPDASPVYTSSQLLSSQIPPPTPLPWYSDSLAWQWNFSRNSLKKARQLRKDNSGLKENQECDASLVNEGSMIQQTDESLLVASADLNKKAQEEEEEASSGNSTPLDPTTAELAALVQNFHAWLVCETQLGNISRQEAVSMLPPLLLNVLPNDRVLDMCAAPGSKTTQLVESLHACANQGDFMNIGTGGQGLVIGNDADAKRCYTLVHQVKRLSSPCCVITNYDAMNFPNLYLNDPQSVDGSLSLLQFDKVLCDVPCSGDGTLRKNPLIWRTWAPQQANGLHRMQYRILERGAQLARIGATIVYSTCSLNPVENEAVVATLLLKHPGCYRLRKQSALPGLKKRSGVKEWSVMTKINDQYARYERYDQVPEEGKRKYLSTLFSSDEHRDLGLEDCWRIFPQDQDTGGFFIAIIEKLAESHKKEERRKVDISNSNVPSKEPEKLQEQVKVKEADEEEKEQGFFKDNDNDEVNDGDEANDNDNEFDVDGEKENDAQPSVEGGLSSAPQDSANTGKSLQRHHLFPRKGNKAAAFKEEPFLPIGPEGSSHMEEIESVLTFYGVSHDFPINHLMVRSDVERKKTYYYVSGTVHQLLTTPLAAQIRFVNTGVKLFARNEAKGDAPCVYRICQEGLRVILPFMTGREATGAKTSSRVLLVSAQTSVAALRNVRATLGTLQHCRRDIARLLSEGNVLFHQLENADLRQHLYAMHVGCAVLLLDLAIKGVDEKDNEVMRVMERSIAVACWRGKASFSILAVKEERSSLLKRFKDSDFYVDDKLESSL